MPNPLQPLRLIPLAALLCAALAWQAAGAATSAAHYRVGVEEVDYYPIYSAVPPDNHYRGYARDLLDLFAAREGLRLTYVALPVRRLSHAYRSGQLDLVFPDNPRWDAELKPADVAYSQAVLQFQDAMLVLPSRLGQPRESYRKLGFIRGFTPWKFADDIAAGRVQIHEAPNPEGLIRMTLAGYIDAANLAPQVAHYHLKRLGYPHSLVVEPTLLPLRDSYYHLSSIRHPQLIRRFDAFLLRERRAVQALRDKYEL